MHIRYLLLVGVMFLAGCKTMEVVTSVGADLAAGTGVITADQAGSIKKTGEAVGKTGAAVGKAGAAVGKAFEKFTPENEHYLGRAVAAQLLGKYKARDDARLNAYVNDLGQTLAAFSDKPETFKGYHFMVLDTDEVNAFAAPGGFVLVSRGLLKCCKREDELAAVLAHEIGHVQLEHGIKAIKKGRWTAAGMAVVAEGVKSFGPKEIGELTAVMESSVNDMVTALVSGGYAQQSEYEADAAAVVILGRVGYDPAAMREVLEELQKRTTDHDSSGFGKTHPTPKARIAKIDSQLKGVQSQPVVAERQKRFESRVAGL